MTCANKYALSGQTSQCEACTSPCVMCGSSPTDCLNCEDGYYFQTTSGTGSCTACSAGCVICSSSSCLACQPPALLSGGNCVSCANGCSLCTTLTFCLVCTSPSSYPASDGTCTQCSSLCLSCSGAGLTACTGCIAGAYFKSPSTCTACPFSCVLCSGAFYC